MREIYLHVAGMPEYLAKGLAEVEEQTANGVEARIDGALEHLTGSKGMTIEDFVEENKEIWM